MARIIRVSDAEAKHDFASVLERVGEGVEVIIERGDKAVAIVRPPDAAVGRPISESIGLAEAHAKELGYEPAIDADFAADLKEIINGRKPRDHSSWE